MTKTDVLNALRAVVKRHKTQSAAATALGVTPPYLHDVLNGRREPGPRILKALGLERAVVYGKVR